MKKIYIACLVLLAAACSWRSPDSEFYVMDSSGLQPVSAKKTSVSVARVKVPDMLDRPQLVISDKDSTKVQILEFRRWGEVYPDILQSTVTNDLIKYLPRAYVKRTYFDGDNTDYSVNIEVNRLQAYPGDKVLFSAWWNIKDNQGNIVKKHQGGYEAKVDGDDMQSLVDAQAAAVHQMSKEIAESLAALKK